MNLYLDTSYKQLLDQLKEFDKIKEKIQNEDDITDIQELMDDLAFLLNNINSKYQDI